MIEITDLQSTLPDLPKTNNHFSYVLLQKQVSAWLALAFRSFSSACFCFLTKAFSLLAMYLCAPATLRHENVILFFPQILFISGLGCVIGVERTLRFFFQRHKMKGTTAFFGGIIIVLLGFPIIGMIIESYGFFALFRFVFPILFETYSTLN